MLFLWELCQNTVRLIMITTVPAFVKRKTHSCDSVLTPVLSQCNSTYVSGSTSDFILMSVSSQEDRI